MMSLNKSYNYVSLKKEQSKKLGYGVDMVLDSQNDPAQELANVEDLLTQGVSLILINRQTQMLARVT